MAGWVVGFVDGEGCFSVGFVQQPDRKEKTRIRRGYRLGYQPFHEFAVTQGAKSIRSLQELQRFFGVGKLYLNKRYDNHKEHLWRFVVRRREDIQNVIIPFFQQYSLKTAKRADFEKFVKCMHLIEQKEHLQREGLIRLAQIVATMNRQKPRKNIVRILRYYTPTSLKRDKR